MIVRVTVEDAIRNWILQLLPASTVIIDKENTDDGMLAPRPAIPFITIGILNIRKFGRDFIKGPDNVGDTITLGYREVTINIQAYGNNGLDVLSTLIDEIDLTLSREYLQSNNLGYMRSTDIIDVSSLIKTSFERRYSIDVVFSIGAQVIKSNQDYIDTVSAQGTYKDADGNIIYIETLEV